MKSNLLKLAALITSARSDFEAECLRLSKSAKETIVSELREVQTQLKLTGLRVAFYTEYSHGYTVLEARTPGTDWEEYQNLGLGWEATEALGELSKSLDVIAKELPGFGQAETITA